MANTLNITGIVFDCAPGSPSLLTLPLDSGLQLFNGTYVPFAGGTATVSAADPLLDRYDTICADNTGAIQVLTGTPGNTWGPQNDAYNAIAVTLLPAGASAVSTVWDVRTVVVAPLVPAPGQTFAMSFLSAAWVSGDPGIGNVQADTTNINTVAKLQVNYTSASAPHSFKSWLGSGGTYSAPFVYPWLFRLWSRQDPTSWLVFEVTAFTDHSTYCTLTCTVVASSSAGTGTSPPLTTTSLDTIIEFAGLVASAGAVSSVFGRTGAVVAVTGDYAGCLVGIRNLLNGTTSYTKTANTNTAYVECQAGGGACNSGSATAVTGGGGGGGYSASKITTVDSGAHTVAIGAGGAAGAHDGGDTSYTKTGTDGGTAPLAKGGSQGAASSTTSSAGGLGGATGTATGDITAAGGAGQAGFLSSSTVNAGGAGGNTFFGSGGQGGKAAAAGTAGGLYGGGAGGAGSAGSSSNAGGNGLLRITEYT